MVKIFYRDNEIEITREAFSKMHDEICPMCNTETLRLLYADDGGEAWQCSCCNEQLTWVG